VTLIGKKIIFQLTDKIRILLKLEVLFLLHCKLEVCQLKKEKRAKLDNVLSFSIILSNETLFFVFSFFLNYNCKIKGHKILKCN